MTRSFTVSLALLGAACSTPSLAVLPRGGNFEPDGEVALSGSAGGVGVNARNSVEALGLVEDEGVPGLRADLGWGGMTLTLAFQQSEHGGRGTLEAEISDDAISLPAGTDVETEFDMGLGEALLTWDLIPGETVEFGLGLGAALLDLDYDDDEEGDVEAEVDFSGPYVGVSVGV